MALWDFVSRVGTAMVEKAVRDAERLQEAQHARAETPPTSPSYHHGRSDNRTAFVASAPGRAEEAAHAPLAGMSGRTVNKALKNLNAGDPETFAYSDKTDYRTLNTTVDVQYQKATGRTEGKRSDNLSQRNLDRIRNGLDGIDTVVAYGKPAQEAVKASGFQGKIIEAPHPSLQNINRNISSNADSPTARADERVSKYAAEILKQTKS